MVVPDGFKFQPLGGTLNCNVRTTDRATLKWFVLFIVVCSLFSEWRLSCNSKQIACEQQSLLCEQQTSWTYTQTGPERRGRGQILNPIQLWLNITLTLRPAVMHGKKWTKNRLQLCKGSLDHRLHSLKFLRKTIIENERLNVSRISSFRDGQATCNVSK